VISYNVGIYLGIYLAAACRVWQWGTKGQKFKGGQEGPQTKSLSTKFSTRQLQTLRNMHYWKLV